MFIINNIVVFLIFKEKDKNFLSNHIYILKSLYLGKLEFFTKEREKWEGLEFWGKLSHGCWTLSWIMDNEWLWIQFPLSLLLFRIFSSFVWVIVNNPDVNT